MGRKVAVVAALLVFSLCWLAVWLTRLGSASVLDEPPGPEVAELLGQADLAIRQLYNYTLALEHLGLALDLAPRNAAVMKFYATVLLALGRVAEAHGHLRAVFRSGVSAAQDAHFLQQYVLALHRLEARAELEEAWPAVTRLAGLGWRSPMQCPDIVDVSLLDDAVPFPEPKGLRVAQLMAAHSAEILAEFRAFQQQPGWDSPSRFSPNQDNDLVLGNDPRRWTEMLLFDRGTWQPRGCKLLPTACKALQGLLEVEGIAHGKRSGQVSLLKLEAGTSLVPHFGSVNWRYTAHLGLAVPEGVVMYAGNESRSFVQGEVLVLDDSFLHSVEHGGQGPRVTLFANFFHPKVEPMTHEDWLLSRHAD